MYILTFIYSRIADVKGIAFNEAELIIRHEFEAGGTQKSLPTIISFLIAFHTKKCQYFSPNNMTFSYKNRVIIINGVYLYTKGCTIFACIKETIE